MLIAILGYRQATCRETSTNSSRPLSVNSRTACFLAANVLAVFKMARTRAESSISMYKYEQKR